MGNTATDSALEYNNSVIKRWKCSQYAWALSMKAIYSTETITSTHKPLFNTVRYNIVVDITQLKDGSQKCTDNIEK